MPLRALDPSRLANRVSMPRKMPFVPLSFRSFTCPVASPMNSTPNSWTSRRGPTPPVSSSCPPRPLRFSLLPGALISVPSGNSLMRYTRRSVLRCGAMPSWSPCPLLAANCNRKPLTPPEPVPPSGSSRSKRPSLSIISTPQPPPPPSPSCRLFSDMACRPSSGPLPRRLWLPSPGSAPVSGSARTPVSGSGRPVLYEQGQSPEPGIREYFYYIDHLGQLFLDDAKIKNFTSCFKDKKFLVFFFQRLKANDTSRYRSEFPWLSLCGRERNYIRCADRPCVFIELLPPGAGTGGQEVLAFGRAGMALTVPFEPQQLCMSRASGRLYHPASERFGAAGLVSSDLAMRLSPFFRYDSDDESVPPSHFEWQGRSYKLTNRLWDALMEGEV